MKSPIFLNLFIAAIICLAIACNKDNNNKKQMNCLLKSLSETRTGGNTTWDFTYNNAGKLASITTTSAAGVTVKDLTYTGNTIIGIAKLGGVFQMKDSVTLDTRGRILNMKRVFDLAGTVWENIALEFNGDVLSKVHKSNSFAPTPVTRIATYANGNLVSLANSTSTTTYEYFPENAQVGDFMNLVPGMIDWGLGLYPHQSLFKSSSSGGSTTTSAVYEKNADGLIVKSTVMAGGNQLNYTFQYDCK